MQGKDDGIALVWVMAAFGVAVLTLAVLLATFLPTPPPVPPY